MGNETRARDAGVDIDMPLLRAGNFDLAVDLDGVIYVAGSVALEGGQVALPGRLGEDLSLEQGQQSARGAGTALLAALHQLAGGLDAIERVVRLTGYVNSAPTFTEQPKVINGASDLMIEVFADAGRHTRSAIGVAALPLGASVEIEGIFAAADRGPR